MEIYTIEDIEFPKLLSAWSEGRPVGRYWQAEQAILVAVTNQFVIVGPENNPRKLAVKPVRTLAEAEELALKFIERERKRGSQVELVAPSES